MAKKTIKPQPKCINKGAHHWVLEDPNSKFSRGRCKICNKTYEHFPNQTLDTNWATSGGA